MTTFIDEDTGETFDKKYAQLLIKDIGLLFGLTPTEMGLFFLMVETLVKKNNNTRNNVVSMAPKQKKVYAEKLGLSTTNSVSNSLRRMVLRDIIKPTEEGSNSFHINPSLIYYGNDFQHAAILTTYSGGERHIKVLDKRNIHLDKNKRSH